jgi:hypothetical protein
MVAPRVFAEATRGPGSSNRPNVITSHSRPALFGVRRLAQFVIAGVQPGKGVGVGLVAEACVDRAGTGGGQLVRRVRAGAGCVRRRLAPRESASTAQ